MKLLIALLFALMALSYASNSTSNSTSLSSSPPSSPEDDDDGGFHIHPSLPDGNYRVTMRDKGLEPLVKRWSPIQRRWQPLVKRAGTGQYTFLVDDATGRVTDVSLDVHGPNGLPVPVTSTHCHHMLKYDTLKWSLIEDDYRASKQALFNWCEVYSYKNGHLELALRGNVAVYVCQRKSTTIKTNFCSEAEFKEAERHINETCGTGPGWAWINAWNKEYGRAWKGEKACRRWGKLTTNNGEAFRGLDVWNEPHL